MSKLCKLLLLLVSFRVMVSGGEIELKSYRVSPKLAGPAKLRRSHAPDDALLNKLDEALAKIANVYMQALFSGTHTVELESRMRALEIRLFELLDTLYKQERMADYMRYEAEVTRQMIVYNLLKRLFGYATDDVEIKEWQSKEVEWQSEEVAWQSEEVERQSEEEVESQSKELE